MGGKGRTHYVGRMHMSFNVEERKVGGAEGRAMWGRRSGVILG